MGVHTDRNLSGYLGLIMNVVFVHLEDCQLDSGILFRHINNFYYFIIIITIITIPIGLI